MKYVTMVCALCLPLVANDDIVGWRLDGSGHFAKADPPIELSPEKNVVWKTAMPNWSNAQPILVGDKLFVNAEPATLICIDARSGEILWQAGNDYADILSEREMAELTEGVAEKAAPIRAEIAALRSEMQDMRRRAREDKSLRGKVRGLNLKIRELTDRLNQVDPLNLPAKHRDNGYTSAVPVSDGAHVYAVYGTGVAVAYDLEGNRKWANRLEKPEHSWGHSATPLLIDDLVIVHIRDVVAFDKKTGAERWRTPAKEAWGSPIAVPVGGKTYVMTAREADFIDAVTGEKVAEDTAGLEYATPLMVGDMLYFIEKKARAFRIPASLNEGLERVWEARIKGSRHYASSLVHDGLIYAVSREGWMSVLDQASGELFYERELGINGDNHNSIYPSVSFAGGHIYIGCEEGTILVLEPGRAYKEIARNQIEKFRGTPIFAGNRIYLRGLENLYCFSDQ